MKSILSILELDGMTWRAGISGHFWLENMGPVVHWNRTAGLLKSRPYSNRWFVERNLEMTECQMNNITEQQSKVMICFDKIFLCAEQIKGYARNLLHIRQENDQFYNPFR